MVEIGRLPGMKLSVKLVESLQDRPDGRLGFAFVHTVEGDFNPGAEDKAFLAIF